MAHSAIMSVRITGNATDAIKAFEKTTAKAAAFGSAMGGLALKGVSALWDGVKGFASDVVNMSDSTNKFMNTMNFADIDTSIIQKVTKEARAYADQTVYGLDDIQSTTAQLAANGIQDYMGLTKAAGNLNAVAGGNKDTFKSVAMVLTQTAGAGKLTTENWNQLANAIPGASGKIQDALSKAGAFTGNFRDAMAKGEISADEFNKALMDLGMTDVAQQAAASTQTMEGAVGNFEAAVVGGLTDAFEVFKPMVTGALSEAADKVSAFSSRATNGLKGIISLVKDGDFTSEFAQAFNIDEDSPIVVFLLNLRTNVIDTFTAGKQYVTDFVNAFMATGPVQAAADKFGSMWGTIQSVGNAVKSVVEQFQPLISNVGGASNVGTSLGEAFGTATDILGSVVDLLKGFSDWVAQNAEPISAALVAIGTGFAVFKVASLISTMVSALQGFSLATTSASVAQWAMNVAMNANPIMLLVTAIAALVAGLIWFFTQTDTGRKIWQGFMDWIQVAFTNIARFFSNIWNNIIGFFSNAGTNASNIWNGVVGFFQNIPSRIIGFFSGIGSAISAPFTSAFGAIKSMWNNTIGGFGFTVPDWIPLIGGKSFKIPKLATGGILSSAGTVMVGEAGPELLTLPRGAQVTPLSRATYNFGGDKPVQPIVYNITVSGVLDGEDAARKIKQVLAQYDSRRA